MESVSRQNSASSRSLQFPAARELGRAQKFWRGTEGRGRGERTSFFSSPLSPCPIFGACPNSRAAKSRKLVLSTGNACYPGQGSSKPEYTNPGLVKFFISIDDPALNCIRRKARTVRLVFKLTMQAFWWRIRLIFRNEVTGKFRRIIHH